MKSSLKNMVLVLFTITAISALLVALVNDVTKDAIAEAEQQNKDLAKLEVLPSFEGEAVMNDKPYQIGDFTVNVTEVKVDGEILGYAVEAPSLTTNGYADKIYLMVGFVEDEAGRAKIHGVKVLSQKETPGLGANMIKPGNKLESSILGKYADDLVFKVKKDDASGSFDALTGSTISSRAYANAVETAYAGYLMAKGQLISSEDDEAENSAEDATNSTTVSEPDLEEPINYVERREEAFIDITGEEVATEELSTDAKAGIPASDRVEPMETVNADADVAESDAAMMPVIADLDESETQEGGK